MHSQKRVWTQTLRRNTKRHRNVAVVHHTNVALAYTHTLMPQMWLKRNERVERKKETHWNLITKDLESFVKNLIHPQIQQTPLMQTVPHGPKPCNGKHPDRKFARERAYVYESVYEYACHFFANFSANIENCFECNCVTIHIIYLHTLVHRQSIRSTGTECHSMLTCILKVESHNAIAIVNCGLWILSLSRARSRASQYVIAETHKST